MKKATLASLAVWLTAALLMVGWQIAKQNRLMMSNGVGSHAMTWICIGLIAASFRLMRSADRRELFPSPFNARIRNVLNVLNIVAGIGAAFAFTYLVGAFGSIELDSILFAVAVAALLSGLCVQATFAFVTNQRRSD